MSIKKEKIKVLSLEEFGVILDALSLPNENKALAQVSIPPHIISQARSAAKN